MRTANYQGNVTQVRNVIQIETLMQPLQRCQASVLCQEAADSEGVQRPPTVERMLQRRHLVVC